LVRVRQFWSVLRKHDSTGFRSVLEGWFNEDELRRIARQLATNNLRHKSNLESVTEPDLYIEYLNTPSERVTRIYRSISVLVAWKKSLSAA